MARLNVGADRSSLHPWQLTRDDESQYYLMVYSPHIMLQRNIPQNPIPVIKARSIQEQCCGYDAVSVLQGS